MREITGYDELGVQGEVVALRARRWRKSSKGGEEPGRVAMTRTYDLILQGVYEVLKFDGFEGPEYIGARDGFVLFGKSYVVCTTIHCTA